MINLASSLLPTNANHNLSFYDLCVVLNHLRSTEDIFSVRPETKNDALSPTSTLETHTILPPLPPKHWLAPVMRIIYRNIRTLHLYNMLLVCLQLIQTTHELAPESCSYFADLRCETIRLLSRHLWLTPAYRHRRGVLVHSDRGVGAGRRL
jgi:hypothetical protein